jgi:hypothetical protein
MFGPRCLSQNPSHTSLCIPAPPPQNRTLVESELACLGACQLSHKESVESFMSV